MLFQKTKMCFNEPDDVTVYCHEHNANKRCQNGAKNATIKFLSYYCQALVRKGLLQAHHDKYCSLVKLLCIYFCYFIRLNHG